MSNSTALVGSALVGQARVGALGATPPAYLRAGGGCWKRVTDPEIVKAAQAAKDYADTQDQTVLDQAASAAQDKADAAQAEAVRLAELAATEADEALEAALGDLVADKSNVFIQDVAPVAEMQKPGVLWIDTTPVAVDGAQVPGNVPKTWSGTAWVAITDSAVVQAATEAAAAHTAAEDAADVAGAAMAEARYAPRTANRPPTQADGVDKPIGAGWHEYGETTNHLGITKDRLVQTWMWTGSAWVRLDMDPQMIPVIQIGTGTFGDLTGDRVTVTGTLSANIVNAMDVNTKKLVVTEETILNHATLIGDTVVDNINVTGKLIGTDGVFTGTVDFENVNVTGLQLVEKLEAHSISADLIEGGAFVGESFTGGTFIGGEFRTSDTLPGQVTLSDTAYVNSYDDTKQGPGDPAPGISVEPINTANLATYPGIGPYLSGIKLDGGSNTSGGWSSMAANPTSAVVASKDGAGGTGHLQVSPNLGTLRAFNATGEGSVVATPALSALTTTGTGGASGKIEVSPSSSIVRTYSGTGPESGWVRAQATDAELASVGADNVYTSRLRATATEASLFSRAGGTNRYLTVDATGVWVKSGSRSYNLEGTTWTNLTLLNGWQAYAGAGGYYNGLRAQRTPLGIRLDGMVKSGSVGVVAVLPDDMQDVAAKIFTAPAAGDVSAFLEISTSTAHSNKYCLKYRSGPSAPIYVSVSTDAALL